MELRRHTVVAVGTCHGTSRSDPQPGCGRAGDASLPVLRIYSANNQGVPYRAEISQINSNLYVFQLINLFDLVRFV